MPLLPSKKELVQLISELCSGEDPIVTNAALLQNNLSKVTTTPLDEYKNVPLISVIN